jgi:hypothetical protein
MPRKKPAPETPPLPVAVEPNAVYSMAQARAVLNLAASTLEREVALRRIRYARRGGRLCFLGRWLIQWLEDGAEGPGCTTGDMEEPSPDGEPAPW